MAWTQTDLDKLDSAIAKGVRSVQYTSGTVTYHSLAEMLRLREVMKASFAGALAPARTVGAYSSGLR